MMKLISRTCLVLLSLLALAINTLLAQEYKSNNFYYNNFDGGQIGTAFNKISSDASLMISSSSPLVGAASLASNGSGKWGVYELNALAENTKLSNEKFGWEWTFVYRSNINSANANNSWKYWLTRASNSESSKGIYLTQEGTKLYLKYYASAYDVRSWELSSITKGNTYSIRVQRISNNAWWVFVDNGFTAKGATVFVKETGHLPDGNADYYASRLELKSEAAHNFVFDELKVYSMNMQIIGANHSENGVSNSLSANQKDAIIYGLKIATRGLFQVYQLVLELQGNAYNVLVTGSNKGKLFRSSDSYFGNADDVLVTTTDVYSSAIQKYGFNTEYIFSTGNEQGESQPTYYYFTVDVRPDAAGSFQVKSLKHLQSYDSNINYAVDSQVTSNTSTGDKSVAQIKDWKGAQSSNWNSDANWSPSGKPGINDHVRIGVVNFNHQPKVSGQINVGKLQIGTTKKVQLTIDNNAELKVSGQLLSEGAMGVDGAGLLSAQSIELKSNDDEVEVDLTVNDILVNDLKVNAQGEELELNLLGKNVRIGKALIVNGTDDTEINFGNQTTLFLSGQNPIQISGNPDINFKKAKLVFNGETTQNIPVNIKYGDIAFEGNGQKILASGELFVAGNWISAGAKVDFQTNRTKVNFNGENQQINDLGSDSGKGVYFADMLIAEGTKHLSTTGKFAILPQSVLSLDENAILFTADNFTFKADENGSASLASVPVSSSVQGQVVVERFIKGGSKDMWRTNRMLSSPVYDNTTDFINTDNGMRTYSFTQFIDDIIVSGTGGSKNGFDDTPLNNPSAWYYDKKFVAIPNINTKLAVGNGAYLFYRGDRTNFSGKLYAPFVDVESLVMTFKGVLNQQNVTVTLGKTTLLGNPYAATIDWHKVSKPQNIGKVLKVWNPSIRQYSVYNGKDGINGGSRYIGAGQSFFIQTKDNAPASITFKESDKVSTVQQSATLYNKVMAGKEANLVSNIMGAESFTVTNEIRPSKLRITMSKDQTESDDETLLVFTEGDDANVTEDDVLRAGGEVLYMSSLSAEGKQMAINYMPEIAKGTKVSLGVNADDSGSFSLKLKGQDLPKAYRAILIDKYLNVSVDLSLTDSTYYTFTIDKSIPASYGVSRFEVMFTPVSTLPIVQNSIKAEKTSQGVVVSWVATPDEHSDYFELYRSTNGQDFQKLTTVMINGFEKYSFLDKNPVEGNNYYQLVQANKDGKKISFNPVVVRFQLDTKSESLNIFPTEVRTNFNVSVPQLSLTEKAYQVLIYSSFGTLQKEVTISRDDLLKGTQISIEHFQKGIYTVELRCAESAQRVGFTKILKF